MKSHNRHWIGAGALAALLMAGAGCDSALEVADPDLVIGDKVDPDRDAEALARSAFQNFTTVFGRLVVYIAWFTNEAHVGDTFPTRNEFGRRTIDAVSNGTLTDELWSDLSRAGSSSEEVLYLLQGASDAGSNVYLANASLASGYSTLLMAETFCEGTVRIGAAKSEDEEILYGERMNTTALLDHAISRFQQAITIGEANGTADGLSVANAARVGLARANLFKGDKAAALGAAAEVPVDFEYAVPYFDDVNSRDRLGNDVYLFTVARLSLVVGPEWRAIADAGDARISYADAGRLAQDGEHEFYYQTKYISWADPIRLASGLEARYIHAEASGDMSEQLDLIAERRAANGLPAFSSSDPAEVHAELMMQKARDFWLEGQRMGDWRRNLDNGAVPFVLESGTEYYKSGQGTIGNQTCWPVPDEEYLNNPNWGEPG